MKTWIVAAVAVGIAMAGASTAEARQGCGPGAHRGPYGHCHPNDRPRGYGAGPALIVDQFYAGRGYWDGSRYWQHRDRWHNGWRYR